jgi:hypothetical protein
MADIAVELLPASTAAQIVPTTMEWEIYMMKVTKLAAALLTSGLAIGAYTAGIAPASAASAAWAGDGDVTTASTQTFKNEATGECLDDYEGDLWTYDCDGSAEQEWEVHRWNDGTVRLKNLATGACLSDSDGTLGTSSTCTDSEYQSFVVKHWNDGTIRFQNEGSGQCVEAGSGHEVWSSRSCDSSESQSWYWAGSPAIHAGTDVRRYGAPGRMGGLVSEAAHSAAQCRATG